MYTSKKHTSNTCAWQRANPDQSGSSINLQHNYYTSNRLNIASVGEMLGCQT